jgi:hypothetical protein
LTDDQASRDRESLRSECRLPDRASSRHWMSRLNPGDPRLFEPYGLLIVLEAISLRMLKLSTPAKWLRVLATMAVVAAISFAVA